MLASGAGKRKGENAIAGRAERTWACNIFMLFSGVDQERGPVLRNFAGLVRPREHHYAPGGRGKVPMPAKDPATQSPGRVNTPYLVRARKVLEVAA